MVAQATHKSYKFGNLKLKKCRAYKFICICKNSYVNHQYYRNYKVSISVPQPVFEHNYEIITAVKGDVRKFKRREIFVILQFSKVTTFHIYKLF